MSEIHVFASFDVDHDRELYERLLAQSATPGFTFDVLGASERYTAGDLWSEGVRRRIREADQVIVICGEHTDESLGVFAELRIAQEEQRPYFLLWGWRDSMCKKPAGAKPTDGMYSWTLPILLDQIDRVKRAADREEVARGIKRPGGHERPSGLASPH